jgi:hypothetical protein
MVDVAGVEIRQALGITREHMGRSAFDSQLFPEISERGACFSLCGLN